MTNLQSDEKFVIAEWKDKTRNQLVAFSQARKKWPQLLIDYYLSRYNWPSACVE
jgi:Chromo shadow domain